MPYKLYDVEIKNDSKSEEALQAVLYRHEMAIHELVDEVKKLNQKFNPISDITMYLGITQDEEYMLIQNISQSTNDFETKFDWAKKWINENIFEVPDEYIKKIVYTYTNMDDV